MNLLFHPAINMLSIHARSMRDWFSPSEVRGKVAWVKWQATTDVLKRADDICIQLLVHGFGRESRSWDNPPHWTRPTGGALAISLNRLLWYCRRVTVGHSQWLLPSPRPMMDTKWHENLEICLYYLGSGNRVYVATVKLHTGFSSRPQIEYRTWSRSNLRDYETSSGQITKQHFMLRTHQFYCHRIVLFQQVQWTGLYLAQFALLL